MRRATNTTPVNLPVTIKNLEELILSSTGTDPFEEILKLIYTKLYFEKRVGESRVKKNHRDTSKKIQDLFEKAKREWPGTFDKNDKIQLSPAHLKLSLNLLWQIPLYQTNLEIIDTAFEYLLPKAAKGSRGQYFTPRHVIHEIIKIINPKQHELILDPACGSGGFLLHALKHVNDTNFSKNLFGIDYDTRMTRIAKAMLLLADATNCHIYKANALSPVKEIKENSFDIVCTNPPFGGEVRDEKILAKYTLAKNSIGKTKNFSERHILFLEKIIQLLKPGGRAAIVVPQGILNNTNLAYIRDWLFSQARILGVISLDTNTFKPHTNVKTSLLFLQKWKQKPLIDYPIFMSVSNKSGKNLSGNIIYKNHAIDSDLPHIADNFREFIKKEKIGF